MGRKLSGFLAALWLFIGSTEAALAAHPRPVKSAQPSPTRTRTKTKKKSLAAKKRLTRKKAQVALVKAPRKPRKKTTRTRKRTAQVPRRYIRSFHALVTAYIPINTPMEGGRWTCTMRDGWKTHGIAVDPQYIPLGSLLYVPGYGRAIADDTGGRIKGRHIDVRHHSAETMHRWGVKRLRVYVLKHPKKKKRSSRLLSV